MKRTLLVAALLIASTGVASAGVYGGLSLGGSAAVQDDAFDLESPGRSARILGGYRLGRLSVEAQIYGNTLRTVANDAVANRQIALLGKYNFPLGSNFELFGRAGVQRTWLTIDDNVPEMYDVAGNGIILGPGIEYVLNFVAAKATIRLDYTISYAKSESIYYSAGGVSFTSGQWMLGFTVGM